MESHNKIHLKINSVHRVLAHSYSMYFILFLIGLFLDFMNDFKIFNNPSIIFVGILFLIFGTFLVLWAQRTSRHLEKENISKETFSKGPYRFTRTPTNFGLLFLMVGFGLITNAAFVILFAVISFIFAKIVFLNKQEQILSEKYGAPYLEYKKSVKF